jgi:hypothetical protein
MPHVSFREGKPAVNVKDPVLWAHHPIVGPIIEELGDERVEAIYQGTVEDFWNVWAQSIANDFGYGEIWSEGRSGGWLTTDHAPDWTYTLTEEQYDADLAEAESVLGDLLEQGTCGKCLARLYRSEECVCDEPYDAPEDIEEKVEEQKELVEALRQRNRFFDFASKISEEVKYAGEQFVERLQEAVEGDQTEDNERAYWAARDVLTV